MKILLNGVAFTTSATHLMALVQEQGLDPGSVIAEHNKGVIKQEAWDKTLIRQGDIIELLSFVGGG